MCKKFSFPKLVQLSLSLQAIQLVSALPLQFHKLSLLFLSFAYLVEPGLFGIAAAAKSLYMGLRASVFLGRLLNCNTSGEVFPCGRRAVGVIVEVH